MTAYPRWMYWLRRKVRPLSRILHFFLINSYYLEGPAAKLRYGSNCSFNNAIFNTSSGIINIEDNVIFGYNVMLLTGRHNFHNGRRVSLHANESYSLPSQEVPSDGYDIMIGSGTWIASGVILVGGCSVGNNCIVAAGSVVTKEFGDRLFLAGVPAKVIKTI